MDGQTNPYKFMTSGAHSFLFFNHLIAECSPQSPSICIGTSYPPRRVPAGQKFSTVAPSADNPAKISGCSMTPQLPRLFVERPRTILADKNKSRDVTRVFIAPQYGRKRRKTRRSPRCVHVDNLRLRVTTERTEPSRCHLRENTGEGFTADLTTKSLSLASPYVGTVSLMAAERTEPSSLIPVRRNDHHFLTYFAHLFGVWAHSTLPRAVLFSLLLIGRNEHHPLTSFAPFLNVRAHDALTRTELFSLIYGWRNEHHFLTSFAPFLNFSVSFVHKNIVPQFNDISTTCLVADRLGRHGIGMDLSWPYSQLAQTRLADETPLFAAVVPPVIRPHQAGLFAEEEG